MTINGTDISMLRGDTECLVVNCQTEDGQSRPFAEGDKVTFTVGTSFGRALLTKTVTEFPDGTAVIVIAHGDTNELTPGEYAYDVQLTARDGTVKTIIPPSRFVLERDVTRE